MIICVFLLISYQGVFEVNYEKGLTLSEVADGVSVEDVKVATGCSFQASGKPTWLCIFDIVVASHHLSSNDDLLELCT